MFAGHCLAAKIMWPYEILQDSYNLALSLFSFRFCLCHYLCRMAVCLHYFAKIIGQMMSQEFSKASDPSQAFDLHHSPLNKFCKILLRPVGMQAALITIIYFSILLWCRESWKFIVAIKAKGTSFFLNINYVFCRFLSICNVRFPADHHGTKGQ